MRRRESIYSVHWRRIPLFISCMRRWPSALSKRFRGSPAWPCSGRRPMTAKPGRWFLFLAVLTVAGTVVAPHPGSAHPLGNFSISHYTAIRLESDAVALRYIIDMAEIPAFQEIQDAQIVPQ